MPLTDAPGARAAAEEALRRYDLDRPVLVPLAESFNAVFRVDAHTARYVLRVGPQQRIHPPGASALEDAWTSDLHARGLPVPRIVAAVDGSPSVFVDGRECTVLTWQDGRPLSPPASAGDVAELAAMSALLHDASPALDVRPVGALSGRSALHFDLTDRLATVPIRHRDVLLAARDRAQRALDALWSRPVAPRLVHGDLTPANVVRGEGGLAAIDFQDLTWAHLEQDLAHSIYGVTRGEALADGLRAYRAAYERVRPWPELDLALLVDLVAARRVAMVNLAVHRDRPDLDAYVKRHADALRP